MSEWNESAEYSTWLRRTDILTVAALVIEALEESWIILHLLPHTTRRARVPGEHQYIGCRAIYCSRVECDQRSRATCPGMSVTRDGYHP